MTSLEQDIIHLGQIKSYSGQKVQKTKWGDLINYSNFTFKANKREEQYPRGIVSNDGHSLEIRYFQVGGCVDFHSHYRGSSDVSSSHRYSYGTAALKSLAVDEDKWGLVVGLVHCHKYLHVCDYQPFGLMNSNHLFFKGLNMKPYFLHM